jgi:hypothetical protein
MIIRLAILDLFRKGRPDPPWIEMPFAIGTMGSGDGRSLAIWLYPGGNPEAHLSLGSFWEVGQFERLGSFWVDVLGDLASLGTAIIGFVLGARHSVWGSTSGGHWVRFGSSDRG